MFTGQIGIGTAQTVSLDGRTVCVVDDDDDFRAQLSLLLRQSKLHVVDAADSTAAMTSLRARMPDCILLDYNLEQESGLHLYETLRSHFPDLAPVVMVSADESGKAIIRAFRNGVDDYVLKRSLRVEELLRSIRSAIARRDQEAARHEELARLRAHSDFDDLTGVYSRRALTERLSTIAVNRGERPLAAVGILFPMYRPICERFGIVAADRMLRAVAARLRGSVRPADSLGRCDRDLFVSVIDTHPSQSVLDDISMRLRHEATFTHQLDAVQLQISVVTWTIRIPGDRDAAAATFAQIDSDAARIRAETEEAASRMAGWGDPADADRMAETDDAQTAGRERRRQPRWRTLKPGKIVFNEFNSTIDCVVRNLSEGGARLKVEGAVALPEFFHLKIADAGALRRVRKCWQYNNEFGVQFLSG
ncbi:GGDEF domain-containing response regulator [Prosthecodimorpha staleyi]|uniref:Response regulator n=1 Tax=Prosthecodimorpha staleyi TaxID=2840188 RepID=A0A947D566_9HYPH|nr:response regulator [Prosthecodimorpha staleyi]MBT9288387.1 response regulator [Prosthecodimorpha staleyi]